VAAISDVSHCPEGRSSQEGSSDNQPHWSSWFKSPVWKAIKRHRLSSERYCRKCRRENLKVPATHVDHCEPHFGQWQRFMAYENTESLCKRHHRVLRAFQKDMNPLA
jgi:hypothetical protein